MIKSTHLANQEDTGPKAAERDSGSSQQSIEGFGTSKRVPARRDNVLLDDSESTPES